MTDNRARVAAKNLWRLFIRDASVTERRIDNLDCKLFRDLGTNEGQPELRFNVRVTDVLGEAKWIEIQTTFHVL